MKIKLTRAQNKAGVDLRDVISPRRAKLPTSFRGVPVARGRGLDADRFDRLEEERACDGFPDGEFFVVMPERLDGLGDPKVFKSRTDAIAYAKALSNGNVDHRVLRASSELLVIGTENDL